MGGRIYDAHIGRFLQADPFVQSPSNSQNFNRYSYVLNNPLSYTDPSGYIFKALKKYWRVIAAAVVSYYTFGVASGWVAGSGFLSGAVAGGAAGFVGGAVATGSLKGALQGAFSGAVFGGIGAHLGDAATHIQVGAHATAGGMLSELQGGNFGHGFFSAGFTKWAGKTWHIDTGSARNVIGNSLKQAIIGGTASKITGNKFSNGAFTAALQYIVNEAGSKRNHVRRLVSSFDHDEWELVGQVDSGTQSINSKQEILLEFQSDAFPATERWFSEVSARPLNLDGSVMNVIAPEEWFQPVGYTVQTGQVGTFIGPRYILRANLPNPGGYQWTIRIPPQASSHGNSSWRRINVYQRRGN
ncbi:RHS repeat-associated core domain-containing protein [Aliidiomarina iranensis]|nr:RHS repeat-associated core domain-containing protein [Aliidiomarina iranensis]